MPFFFGVQLKNLLFYGYDISSVGGMAATTIGIFSLAFLNEAVKNLRMKLQSKYKRRASIQEDQSEDAPLLRRRRRRAENQSSSSGTPYRLASCASYSLQIVLNYLAMLAVMSYSVWLLIGAVVGTVFGSWLFGNELSLKVQNFVRMSVQAEESSQSINSDQRSSYGAVESPESSVVQCPESSVVRQSQDVILADVHV